jgi:DNA-binding NarL/FixJ family response regulator
MGIRVLIVDHQALVRRGIEAVLRQAPDMEVVGDAFSCSDAVEKACELRPDVIVIDIHIPDRNGQDPIRTIHERCPTANILVLTQQADPEEAIKALEAGAAGFVFKDIAPEHLQAAVRHLSSGEAMLNPTVARYILNRIHARNGNGNQRDRYIRTERLTQRELEILSHLAVGMRDREIAAKLFLAEATVKTYLKAIYRKLGARNRAQAAAVAASSGFVPHSSS